MGPGNNNLLVKGLLKRRFWWVIVDEKGLDCQFVWTQIKLPEYFKKQPSSTTQSKAAELVAEDPPENPTTEKPTRKKEQKPEDMLEKILIGGDLKRMRDFTTKYQQKHSKNWAQRRAVIGKPLLEIEDERSSRVHNHL